MELKVLGSSSKGNCYVLQSSKGECLLLECGVGFDKVKKAVDFNIGNIAGCLVSHEHLDHCKAVKDVMAAGISVWATAGTHKQMGTAGHHRSMNIDYGEQVVIGGYLVKAYEIKHDAEQPACFLINHAESGTILFLTDSYYCEYTFRGLNNVIIEANYCQRILDEKLASGVSPKFLRDRVIQSHMSLDTCKQTLAAYDLSEVNKIVLIHLSDGNSDAIRFKKEVEEATGKTVVVADTGMDISFSKQPF